MRWPILILRFFNLKTINSVLLHLYFLEEISSGGSGDVLVGIVVAIVVLLVFAVCINYAFVYRRRLARQRAARQQAMMVVNHPPPPPQPGYGPPPPVGYVPPPPAGAAPPPQPGYAPPPSYSQVMAAPYPQQGKFLVFKHECSRRAGLVSLCMVYTILK